MSKDQLEELQQERYPWWRVEGGGQVTEQGSHATGSLAAGGVTEFQQLVKSPSGENFMTVLAEWRKVGPIYSFAASFIRDQFPMEPKATSFKSSHIVYTHSNTLTQGQ